MATQKPNKNVKNTNQTRKAVSRSSQKKTGASSKKNVPSKTQASLAKSAGSAPNIQPLNFIKMIESYDIERTRYSLLSYVSESVRWLDSLFALLASLTSKHKAQVVAMQSLINKLFVAQEHDEHPFLKERAECLIRHLYFGIDILHNDLKALKQEFIILQGDLNVAKTLDALCELESRRRPDFLLVAEHSFAMVKRYLDQIGWLLEHQKSISALVKLHHEWRNDFHVFEHTTQAHFMEKCRRKKIPKKTAELIFNEWYNSIILIEDQFLKLVKASISEKIIPMETAIKVASLISVHLRDKLHKFYNDDRIDIHIKCAIQPGYEILEHFEKDAEIGKINAEFQKLFEDLMFKSDTLEGRLFLIRWAEDWYGFLIGEVISSIEKQTLQELLAKTILDEFRAIKQRNLATFLVDVKSYAEAREQKNDEFNALLYRMKQDLMSGLCKSSQEPIEADY